ncbi:hypothetical protein ACLB2K_039287 [Fragaria x ananassa]
MRTIMAAKTPHDSSFSFSRRYFWKKKVDDDEDDDHEVLNFSSYSHFSEEEKEEELARNIHMSTATDQIVASVLPEVPRKKHSLVSVSKLRSALFGKSRAGSRSGLMGTLFGYRRGHVHLAFQEDPKLNPTFLIELATPTSVLVREMASGLVRIALECEKKTDHKKKGLKLLDEPLWRTYCNGKKCGFAMRRDGGPEEWKVLKALEPVSMGAGILPGNEDGAGSEGELMYMRAKFERVVGSKDSEAFYMMNPDGSAGPELSVYLLRV